VGFVRTVVFGGFDWQTQSSENSSGCGDDGDFDDGDFAGVDSQRLSQICWSAKSKNLLRSPSQMARCVVDLS